MGRSHLNLLMFYICGALLINGVSMNPYLYVDKEIMAEIYTGSQLMDNLEVLCDVYGSRFPGTPGDKDSVDYMVEKFREFGCENVHYETFTIPGWTRGPASLEVTSPIKKSFEVISLPHSIGGEADGKLVFLGPGAIDVYDERKEEIGGNIVMVTSANPPGMKRFLHRSEKFMRSVMAGAKGWIFMNHYPAYGPPTGGINPVIPAIGIAHEDGAFLTRLLEREGEVTVKIKTTDVNHAVDTYNVIADVTPDDPVDEEYVIVGSHYDGHDISQGAVDPASGTVTVMEIARNLNLVRDKLKRRVRCMCFGAEEIGLFGSYAYADKHEEELDKCRFMLNLDAAGNVGLKGVVFHDFPELEPLAEKYGKEMKTEFPVQQKVTPYSDHWPFFLKSVPCGSHGGDPSEVRTGRGYGHTRYDTVDKVDLKYLRLAAANYTRFLFRVANEENWNPRRKSPEEIEEFIQEQGYDKTIKLADSMREYIRESFEEIHPDTREWLERGEAW